MDRLTIARGRRPAPGPVRAFSLIELVLVVVIIGIVAAIAAPRFSRAVLSANQAYVESSVATVTRAMALYEAEHDRYPGYNPATGAPDGTWFVKQLLEYSDATGNTQANYGDPFIYGPYLRPPFPTNPINKLDTVQVLTDRGQFATPGGSGWVAVLSTGDFRINATEVELGDLGIRQGAELGLGEGGAMIF